MPITRRSFLKRAAVSGISAATIMTGAGKAAAASVAEGNYALLHDLEKCDGCSHLDTPLCVSACRLKNQTRFPEPEKPIGDYWPQKSHEDWSEKRNLTNRLTPYNWLYIQTASGTYDGKPFELNIPRRCLHCQNPPCANLCPWGAASKDGRGIVAIDDEICLGGSKCKDVCPWHIPERQTGVGLYLKLAPSFAGNGVMFKCDRCQDRVVAGGTPACIEACPEGVQTIGPRDEILAQARKLAEESGGFLYGDTENGGTNTFYVSPVPFDVLNQSIETGPGRPHLPAVADPFTAEDVLARAVSAAPLAGLMAGALHLIRGATSEGKNE